MPPAAHLAGLLRRGRRARWDRDRQAAQLLQPCVGLEQGLGLGCAGPGERLLAGCCDAGQRCHEPLGARVGAGILRACVLGRV